MDSLKELLKGFDPESLLESLLPEMTDFVDFLQLALRLCVMVAPLVLLGLGLYLFLKPPAEANHLIGFRSYRAMASVESWRFSQRLAGMVWGALGTVLTIVMAILCNTMTQKNPLEMAMFAAACLVWELVLVGLSHLAVSITVAVFFDKKGVRRERFAHILL